MMTVTKLFKDLVEDTNLHIANSLCHAIHPATVRLLSKIGFCPALVCAARNLTPRPDFGITRLRKKESLHTYHYHHPAFPDHDTGPRHPGSFGKS